MTQKTLPTFSNQILEEATTWFVEFSEGRLSGLQRERFVQWLRISPEHIRAYLQISAHWEEARTLGKTDTRSIDDLVSLARSDSVEIISLPPPQRQRDIPETLTGRARGRPTRVKPRRWLAIACSILVVTLGGGYWVTLQRNTYSTDTGVQRNVTLADGTTVELNAQSKIRAAFHPHQRDIYLISGQALFHVAKDPTRPFVVHTDSMQIRAVGTQFDVYRKDSGTTVTVLEGTVAVLPSVSGAALNSSRDSSRDSPDPTSSTLPKLFPEDPKGQGAQTGQNLSTGGLGEVLLRAGDQATVSKQGAIAPEHLANTAATTAWTHKQIILKSTPLKEVVAEFNRYNTKQLVITDPSIASVRISGVFSSASPESLLRGLDAVGKFKIQETADRVEISAK